MHAEMASLADNKTKTLVDAPYGKNIIGRKWMFKGELTRFSNTAFFGENRSI